MFTETIKPLAKAYRSGFVAAAVVALSIGSLPTQAQFGPLLSSRQAPQAKSQDEFDQYLEIYTSDDPSATVALVAAFAEAHRASEFLGLAYQSQMTAYRQLGNYAGALVAGRKSLDWVPNNIITMLALAAVIPNGVEGRPDRAELLSEAEGQAQAVLSQLETIKIPDEIPLESWESRKAAMQGEAHEALGHVAVKRGDLTLAVREFQAAVEINPDPKPSQWYRLGGAYIMAGQAHKAVEPLRKAAAGGDDVVRRLAKQQLERIASKN